MSIYENGVYRGAFGTFVITDTFQIERVGTTITYKKNGTVFYTSTIPSTSQIVFDSSIYRHIGAKNISITY